MFGSYSRDQLRQTYVDAWHRRLTGLPLSPLEAMICDVIELHGEYQALVADRAGTRAHVADAVGASENPFLHMGLHLAVREQVAIDRPPGVADLERRLAARLGDAHAAEHVLMEALAEALWEAQRAGSEPDTARYLTLARRRLEG